jgi:hypothetical protein
MSWFNKVSSEKQIFIVFWSNAPEHIGRKIRGVPEVGKIIYLKAPEGGTPGSHYTVEVIGIEKFTKKKAEELKIKEGYYIDGTYNDLKIKRIT